MAKVRRSKTENKYFMDIPKKEDGTHMKEQKPQEEAKSLNYEDYKKKVLHLQGLKERLADIDQKKIEHERLYLKYRKEADLIRTQILEEI